jgi:predicted amidohydrolase YtcJ
MKPSQPCAEAIAITAGIIVKVGTNDEIAQVTGKNTQTIRLNGKTVLPGLIDSHIHVGDFARFLLWMDLTQTRSIKEMQTLLKERLKKTAQGKWVVGRGWDDKHFAEKRLPTRFDLDVVSPENPVIFYYACGPVCVVNSKALQLAGISKQTKAPLGGTFDKDPETGEPTGILRDTATDLAWNKVPEPTAEELVEAAAMACEKVAAAGITTIHWLATSPTDLVILRSLCKEGKLPLRVYIVVPPSFLDMLGSFSDLDKEVARIGGVEVSADGYLAMRTAALTEPYKGTPAMNAALLCTKTELQTAIGKIVDAGYQAVVHAMGDKAVDAALTAFAAFPRSIRNRIDPAALLNPQLIQRIKQQHVAVSVQPLVAASEFQVYSAVEGLGEERARWLYPLKTLLNQGVCVCGGSDCPMEPLNPMLGIQSVVTRQFFPAEQLSVDEALRLYTVNAAYAAGEENLKGSIEEGKLADFTVLLSDPHEVPRNGIQDIPVELTIVGGKVAYSR